MARPCELGEHHSLKKFLKVVAKEKIKCYISDGAESYHKVKQIQMSEET
jgi:hypothetical protein